MIKPYICIVIFLLTMSCVNKNKGGLTESDNLKVEKKIIRLKYNYATTSNKIFLDSAYALIESSKYFEKHELNDDNLELFFSIYFDLEKYSEISHLLNQSNSLDKFKQEYGLNYVNAFSNYKKGNLGSAKNEIKKNIDLIKSKLKSNTLDSMYIVDLYKLKLHLESYDSVIEEVDSLRTNHKGFSEMFYNEILIPELKDYKMELPEYISEIPPNASISGNSSN